MSGTSLSRRDLFRRIGAAGADGIEFTPRPDFFPNLRDLGKGEVDFPGVMRALRDLRYQGWINVEQDFTATTPGKSCRASLEYVRNVISPIYT